MDILGHRGLLRAASPARIATLLFLLAGLPAATHWENPPLAVAPVPESETSQQEASRAPVHQAPLLTADEGRARFARIVERASKAHGVDRDLVQAMILAESSYNPHAVSAAGAVGLMQLMPETARRYGASDPLDPEKNVHAGVRYLKELLVRFDGNMELAVAAYNAGAGAVERAGMRVPNNPETEAFVPRVIAYYHRFREGSDRS